MRSRTEKIDLCPLRQLFIPKKSVGWRGLQVPPIAGLGSEHPSPPGANFHYGPGNVIPWRSGLWGLELLLNRRHRFLQKLGLHPLVQVNLPQGLLTGNLAEVVNVGLQPVPGAQFSFGMVHHVGAAVGAGA